MIHRSVPFGRINDSFLPSPRQARPPRSTAPSLSPVLAFQPSNHPKFQPPTFPARGYLRLCTRNSNSFNIFRTLFRRNGVGGIPPNSHPN